MSRDPALCSSPRTVRAVPTSPAAALAQLTPSAVVAMDAEGRVLALNGAAAALLAPNADDAVGRPYTDVFGPSLADRMLGLFMRVSRAGASPGPQLVEATLPSGRRARLRATAGPLLDDAGRLTGLLFAAEDKSAEDAAVAHEGRLRDALGKYVGQELAATIDARPSFVDLGGRRQVVSVMHADVRGYSTISEQLEPEEVMRRLLASHGPAVAALRAEGGLIDRFIGDAVLALWNAPSPQPGHTRMAIRGALAMQRATADAGTGLRYGAAVHVGPAIVGNLGSDQFMSYTAIGDVVNVAARLQGAAPAGEVLCSGAALEAAGEGVRAVPLGPISVKGRTQAVEAFRVDGIDA